MTEEPKIPIEEYPLQEIPLSEIAEDPLNQEMFTENDVAALAEDMRMNGFLGVIVVYPVEQGYRIESGHRRYYAALENQFEKIPVYVSVPPANLIERRERLARWNLHGRNFSPMDQARRCQFQYDTYVMKNQERKKKGLETVPILENVAFDLDLSVSNVTKYKMLLNLIPELQEMADSGNYSWAILAKASVLPKEQQKMLHYRILGQTRLFGPTAATGKWIEEEIRNYKQFHSAEKRIPVSALGRLDYRLPSEKEKTRKEIKTENKKEKQEKGKRFRRKIGVKEIRKSRELLFDALEENTLIREEEHAEIRQILKEIQDLIERRSADFE